MHVRTLGRSRTTWAGTAALMLAATSAFIATKPAQAHRRDFPFTYDWQQPSQGEREIETHSNYSRADHTFEQQVEFEYGLTNRFMLAPYINYTHEPGGHLRYSGFQLESRYQFGKYRTNKILAGAYLEFEKPRDESWEVEPKLILSRYSAKGENISLNLTGERSLNNTDTKWRKAYSFGYARGLGKSKLDFRGGFECVRNLDNRAVDLGPVLSFAPYQSEKNAFFICAGYGFPVNKRSENKGQARVLAEFEF
jgi:hypothetical protein